MRGALFTFLSGGPAHREGTERTDDPVRSPGEETRYFLHQTSVNFFLKHMFLLSPPQGGDIILVKVVKVISITFLYTLLKAL